MAKSSAPAHGPSVPRLFKAILGRQGAVAKSVEVTREEAVAERLRGNDIVVCGPDTRANMLLAMEIERTATAGKLEFHNAHRGLGKNALSHFQPKPRRFSGHTFFEAPPHRTAK